MSKELTHIVMILDRSGSMCSCRKATVDGFDEFINRQQREPGKATVTLVQFDDQYEVVYREKDVQDITSIKDVYRPRGMTALLDAIGKTVSDTEIKLTMKSKRNIPAKVLCVIITDGYENASREYTRNQIFEKVRELEKGNWEFIFLGANQDAIQEGSRLGIKGSSSATYTSNTAGTMAGFGVVSNKAAFYRGISLDSEDYANIKSGKVGIFTDEDRDELAKD